MEGVDFSYGSFNISFKQAGEPWYMAVHPEMCPAQQGIKPSGRYFVYCIHPMAGSMTFIVEQDEECKWICQGKPQYISDLFVEWVGKQIEGYNR